MLKQNADSTAGFGPVVFSYSRAQALADGVLVDVTEMAREAGFKWPVALTHAVWEDCVAWTEADSERQGVHQDQSDRLWDVLWMAYCAIRVNQTGGSELRYKLYRLPRDGKARKAEPTTLKLAVGPGDHGEPVITILQPEED
jgi:hypothetical protein